MDKKEDIHHRGKKEVHHSKDVHHGDRKEAVDHSLNPNTTEPKSTDTVTDSIVHEVCSLDERGNMVEMRKNRHHDDEKEEVNHNSDSSTEHVESKKNKFS